MFLRTGISLLVFTSTVCFGYDKLERYQNYLNINSGGVVFRWMPQAIVYLHVVNGKHVTKFDDLRLKLGDDKSPQGDIGLTCYEVLRGTGPEGKETFSPVLPNYYRLQVRVAAHGYEGDETHLDDFKVTTCDKEKLKNMFEVSRTDKNNYHIKFKGIDKICYDRELLVSESELTLTVIRRDPKEKPCSDFKNDFETKDGSVVPNSWIESGSKFDVYDFEGEDIGIKSGLFTSSKPIKVKCKAVKLEEQSFHITDIMYKGLVIDRLVTKKCDSGAVKDSMYLEKIKAEEGETHEVEITYLTTRNGCHTRPYLIDFTPVENDDLVTIVRINQRQPEDTDCLGKQFASFFHRMV